MTAPLDSLEDQLARYSAFFEGGWTSKAQPAVVPTESLLERVRRYLGDPNAPVEGVEVRRYAAYVRRGGIWGATIPAVPIQRMPISRFIDEGARCSIVGDGDDARVVIVFSSVLAPSRRFGYRFPPPGRQAEHAEIFFVEEVEAGWIGRRLRAAMEAEDGGILWLN